MLLTSNSFKPNPPAPFPYKGMAVLVGAGLSRILSTYRLTREPAPTLHLDKHPLMLLRTLSEIIEEYQINFRFVPASPREARFHVRIYGHVLDPNDPHTQAIEKARLANIQLLVESLHEDIRVNYICQDSVSSRLFEKTGVFSIAEYDVAKFQEAIRLKLPLTSHHKKPL